MLLAIGVKYFPYHCCTAARATTPNAGLKLETIKLGTTPVSVEVADTDAARTQGLSDRTSLTDGSGMLFVFTPPQEPGFWMKDMNFALDMIWIGTDNTIVKIDKDVAPSTYPSIFYPPSTVNYVIELPAGFSDAHSLAVGENFSIGQ